MDKQSPVQLASVADFLNWAEQLFEQSGLFYGHGTDNAWDDAVALLAHVRGISPDADRSILAQSLSGREQRRLVELALRRVKERIPVPYLTGWAWFAGLKFKVNRDVLIPRSPIAELINSGFMPWITGEPTRILDLCTGSGCIGIACALAFPQSQVVLSDISDAALQVARENVTLHRLEGRVTVVQSDLFDNLAGQQFDLIVSNPPYVDAGELANMPEEFRHEPVLGLASGIDGLDFTRRLLADAAKYLSHVGTLICEVGNSWDALENAYPETPFNWIEFEYGGHGVFALDRDALLNIEAAG